MSDANESDANEERFQQGVSSQAIWLMANVDISQR